MNILLSGSPCRRKWKAVEATQKSGLGALEWYLETELSKNSQLYSKLFTIKYNLIWSVSNPESKVKTSAPTWWILIMKTFKNLSFNLVLLSCTKLFSPLPYPECYSKYSIKKAIKYIKLEIRHYAYKPKWKTEE